MSDDDYELGRGYLQRVTAPIELTPEDQDKVRALLDEHRDPAPAYRVWRVDCPCGEVVEYGEDEGSVPERCEGCGAPVELSH